MWTEKKMCICFLNLRKKSRFISGYYADTFCIDHMWTEIHISTRISGSKQCFTTRTDWPKEGIMTLFFVYEILNRTNFDSRMIITSSRLYDVYIIYLGNFASFSIQTFWVKGSGHGYIACRIWDISMWIEISVRTCERKTMCIIIGSG